MNFDMLSFIVGAVAGLLVGTLLARIEIGRGGKK